MIVNTLYNGTALSGLTANNAPAGGATASTDADLSSIFAGSSSVFASVTGTNKVYPFEDTQALKLGTSSVAGSFTVNMASGYVATKIDVVFHAYKLKAATLSITSGALTSSVTTATPSSVLYTSGAETVSLATPAGVASFTLASESTGVRAFIYSVTVEFVAVV